MDTRPPAVFPLSDNLNEEEEEILLQELENVREQDLQDFAAESKEDLHDFAAARATAAKRATDNENDDDDDDDDDDKDNSSSELLLENILKKRGIQLKAELSFFAQELVNEAIKHNLNDKEIMRRRLRHTINGLNVVQRRRVVTYIFARRDLIEDPKYTTQDSDIEFIKESERDIIEDRKEIEKMEDDLRKLDD